jgi:two-component system, chemotaxis family, response regulator Rcp1
VETRSRPLDILLIEDNPGDVRLAREGMNTWRIPPQVRVASDGMEALDILRDAEPMKVIPDIILLDLNLPRLSGREVLHEIKSSEALRQIPVIVLSSSDADDDVRTAYDLQANCYVVKPGTLDSFLDMVRGIEQFWSLRARLPST